MNLPRKIISRFGRPLLEKYLENERTYSYQGISIKILPGVFHPGFFFSTKFLLRYLENVELKNRSLLEPGAGSGLISFAAEKKGALVTAADLSGTALEGLYRNREALHSRIRILRSDVFDQLPAEKFDFIIVNPPYYPRKPEEEWQLAWYCGEDFSFFSKLFSRLVEFTHEESKVLMVLSEDCNIFTIRNIAEQHGWNLKEKQRRKFWWEWNFIFECCRN